MFEPENEIERLLVRAASDPFARAAFTRALTDALAAGGAEGKRAFQAMMTMKKIDVAAIEAARRG